MKTNEIFLKAKNDKNLSAFLVMSFIDDRTNERKTIIRLCIRSIKKYTNQEQTTFVETDTEIKIDDYSQRNIKENKFYRISFHESVYSFSKQHVHTFLKRIKKDSNVSFRVAVWNNSDNMRSVDFVNNQLFGIIDNEVYLLSSYTGPNNLASPAQF